MNSPIRLLALLLAAVLFSTANSASALDQSVFRPGPVVRPGGGMDMGGGVLDPGLELPPLPPIEEPLYLRRAGHDVVELLVRARAGTNRLYRSTDAQNYTHLADFAANTNSDYRDDGLAVGQRYCYRLDYEQNGLVQSDFLCVDTDWRVGFTDRHFTRAEKQQVAELFDWRDTKPLARGTAESPALYYMNVWVDDRQTPDGLRDIGVHLQELPVFEEELAGFRLSQALIEGPDGYAGRWYFAVMPGHFYNQIRERVLAQIANGDAPGIRAIVFRGVPVFAARESIGDRHRLEYQYLGERGFEFNGEPVTNCVYDESLGGEVCPYLLGWAARKFAGWVEEGAETLVEGIRAGIGKFQLLYKDDVDFSAQFYLLNTDPGFNQNANVSRYMVSAWRGEALTLPKVRIHVRQGLAGFYGRTDRSGYFRKTILEGVSTRVCVETESDAVELTEFLTEEVVCVANLGKLTGRVHRDIDVQHPYLNALAAMTDAHDYVEQVLGHNMPKITVLVGDMADTIAVAGRSFAPCMGRVPGAIGIGADLLALVVFPPALLATGFAEFVYAVDIVLLPGADASRGVPVHEYGHAVMCHLMGSQGIDAFEIAWTDVIFATADQSPGNDTSYINEAFADFLTSQIVGGTNYFAPAGAQIASEEVNYCLGGADCVENNFSSQASFSDQVARVTSLLHDAFDRASDPNDGSHWAGDGTGGMLPFRRADSVIDDEEIALDPTDLESIFRHWDKRGTLLNEDNFLGGLADLLRTRGYSDAQVCRLFELHGSGSGCPSFVLSSPWNRWNTGQAPGALFSEAVAERSTPLPSVASVVPGTWLAALPVDETRLRESDLEVEAPDTAEADDVPLTPYPVALLKGTQKTKVKGIGKTKRAAAYAFQLGDGWFDVVLPTGDRLDGLWSAKNAEASALRLEAAPEFDQQLAEMLAASLEEQGLRAHPRLTGPAKIQLKVRPNGDVVGKIKIPFVVSDGEDERKGKAVVKLQGTLY